MNTRIGNHLARLTARRTALNRSACGENAKPLCSEREQIPQCDKRLEDIGLLNCSRLHRRVE
jgi:hypothetical protein